MAVRVPAAVFPDFAPALRSTDFPAGFWMAKTVKTNKGGAADVGIKIQDEPVFTRPISEVLEWVVPPCGRALT